MRKIYIREIPVRYRVNRKKKKAEELLISNFKLPSFKEVPYARSKLRSHKSQKR